MDSIHTVSYTHLDVYKRQTWYSYDEHGNVKTLWQNLPTIGTKKIDYEFDLVSSKVKKVLYQDGQPDRFYHKYFYDSDNRIKKAYTSRNGTSWEQDAHYFYYKHGPLARTVLGQDKVQGLDYAYTLQGWIKGVNSNTLKTNRDIARDGYSGTSSENGSLNQYVATDAFGYSLGFYGGDYSPIVSKTSENSFLADNSYLHNSSMAYANLYNGNISNMVTVFGNNTNAIAYKYSYDQLNRLSDMASYTVDNTTNAVTATGKGFESAYTYDRNGNIMTQSNKESGALFDQMTYGRDLSGGRLQSNRLLSVVDIYDLASFNDMPACTTSYTYDKMGNLKTETSAGVTKTIYWNVSGKVKQVVTPNKTLSFGYNGMGNKCYKTMQDGTTIENIYYVHDASGTILATYKYENSQISLDEQYMYGSSRIGTLKVNTQLSSITEDILNTRKIGMKAYELTNHLGNVIATVSDFRSGKDVYSYSGSGPWVETPVGSKNYVYNASASGGFNRISGTDGYADYYEPDVTSYSDYYPFGLQMPGRQFNSEEDKTRFGFNGKEKVDSWDSTGAVYDYGFRIYDVRIGKFLSVDPLIQAYPWYTPYQFAGNMPICAIDLDGLEELIIIRWFDQGGKYTGDTYFRIPVDLREPGKKNGGDVQIIQMEDSKRKDIEDELNKKKIDFINSLKNDKGQFQGFYRKQEKADRDKNGSVIESENSPRLVDYVSSRVLTKDIFYNFDNANPTLLSKEDIEKIQHWLSIDKDRVIRIIGYASDEYDQKMTQAEGVQYNINKSQDRAKQVAQYLIDSGINKDRIKSVTGEGGTQEFNKPGKSADENLKLNRKVQIQISYEKK